MSKRDREVAVFAMTNVRESGRGVLDIRIPRVYRNGQILEAVVGISTFSNRQWKDLSRNFLGPIELANQ